MSCPSAFVHQLTALYVAHQHQPRCHQCPCFHQPDSMTFWTAHPLSPLCTHWADHKRSQRVQWVQLNPQGGEKIRRNLHGKFVSAPPSTPSAPPRQSKSQFLGHFLLDVGNLEVRVVHLAVVLDRLLRATTKNGQLFREIVHSRQNPGYAYGADWTTATQYTQPRRWSKSIPPPCSEPSSVAINKFLDVDRTRTRWQWPWPWVNKISAVCRPKF